MVLIPKGYTDNQGIGLLETLWKVVEARIYTRLHTSIHLHDVLCGFRSRRGTGTVIMEMKLVQKLSRVDHKTLFLVFIKLRKTYDTIDRGRLIQTLEGYGMGPYLCGLPETF